MRSSAVLGSGRFWGRCQVDCGMPVRKAPAVECRRERYLPPSVRHTMWRSVGVRCGIRQRRPWPGTNGRAAGCPGERGLIVGNHHVNRIGDVAVEGFDETHWGGTDASTRALRGHERKPAARGGLPDLPARDQGGALNQTRERPSVESPQARSNRYGSTGSDPRGTGPRGERKRCAVYSCP